METSSLTWADARLPDATTDDVADVADVADCEFGLKAPRYVSVLEIVVKLGMLFGAVEEYAGFTTPCGFGYTLVAFGGIALGGAFN